MKSESRNSTAPGAEKNIPVFLTTGVTYDEKRLTRQIGELLEAVIVDLPRHTRVLVKPNLISGKKNLATTHPLVVKGAISYLLDCGARIVVGDSPAFGSAEKVAEKNGLAAAIHEFPVKVVSLGAARKIDLDCGVTIGLSGHALDTELILNLPKLKAHNQFRVTGAVKNLFGCVVGGRKALAHFRHGHLATLFHQMLLEISQRLPETVSLLDAVTVMSGTGPIEGIACDLYFIGASKSAVALDTAIYTALGLSPADMIVWQESLAKGVLGSDPQRIDFPFACPGDIDMSGFYFPDILKPVTFHPLRLLKGRLKSVMNRIL